MEDARPPVNVGRHGSSWRLYSCAHERAGDRRGRRGGIGAATVRRLLRDDPELPIAIADLAEPPEDIRELAGERLYARQVDISDHAAVQSFVADAAAALGTPTKLVNAAGIQLNKAAIDLTPDDWRRVQGVNLDGPFWFCQAVGRRMLEARRGSIVNVASISMFFGFPRRLAYITTKAALGGLTSTLAVEVGPARRARERGCARDGRDAARAARLRRRATSVARSSSPSTRSAASDSPTRSQARSRSCSRTTRPS